MKQSENGEKEENNMPKDGEWQIKTILIILVGIIVLIMIYQAGPIISEFTHWLNNLFRNARIDMRNERGFAAFMQLIMIAIFVGWAINRFRQ
jgi:hypothetical protein